MTTAGTQEDTSIPSTKRPASPNFALLRRAILAVTVAWMFTSFIARHTRPRGNSRTLVPGPDPVRVLVFGSGLSVGYGVREERLAVCGQLAQALAKHLGRGVVVEHRTGPSVRLHRAIAILGPNGAHTYRAAIYMPALHEVVSGYTAAWREHLTMVLAHLRQTGGSTIPIILSSLPQVLQPTRLEIAGIAPLQALNQNLQAVSESDACVEYVEMPPITTLFGPGYAFDAEYYERCAEHLAAALAPYLLAA